MMMVMMVVRLHVVIQRHAREMVGWFQVVVIIVRVRAVIVVCRRAGGAAAAVIDAVDAVLEEIGARGRPLVVVIVVVVRRIQQVGVDREFACNVSVRENKLNRMHDGT